jgi:DNA-binding Lrp family transcriptional regulator
MAKQSCGDVVVSHVGRVEMLTAIERRNKRNAMLAASFPDITRQTACFGSPMPIELDAIDWRILKELQADGRITNIALANRIGLSAPPCLRRVRTLEEAGLITGYTALIDEAALGYALTAFAMVRLHNQAESDLRAFENLVLSWPLVREAHMLSGESDFMLKCIARDLTGFQDFVLEELTSAPNVASVKTFLTIRRTKREPGIPIGSDGT